MAMEGVLPETGALGETSGMPFSFLLPPPAPRRPLQVTLSLHPGLDSGLEALTLVTQRP